MRAAIVAVFLSLTLAVGAQKNVLSTPIEARVLSDVYHSKDDSLDVLMPQIADLALRAYLGEYRALVNYAAANNASNYATYMKCSDKALSCVAEHKYAHTLTSNLLIHRCMVELSNGNFLTGGLQFWKSYRAYSKAESAYANYDGQLMLRGIFNILLSQIPAKWQRLAGFFGFGKGDLDLGFQQIIQYRDIVKDVPGLCDEALIISFANIFLAHEEILAEELTRAMSQSHSPIVVFSYVLSLGRQQKGAEATELLEKLPTEMYRNFPLLYHQKAKFALRRGDLDHAIFYADKFFNTYKGTTCHSDALLMKAYAHLLKGNATEAQTLADQCAAMTASDDIDERTQAEAQQVATTDATLLRSRMAFEYGDFVRARDILADFAPKSENKIEYHFRFGRAEEKLGNTSAALKHYDQTIALAADDKRYFGPYAAIYAAKIKIAANDYASARAYIAKAQTLNTGEYSKEIEQRISIALSVMGE